MFDIGEIVYMLAKCVQRAVERARNVIALELTRGSDGETA